MGPIWDFDRAMDSANPADDDPVSWDPPPARPSYFETGWWNRMFDDPEFSQAWIDSWQELREGPFSISNTNALIDSLANEMAEAQVRNFVRH